MGLLTAVFFITHLGFFSLFSLVIALVFFVQQQRMVVDRSRDGCFAAFLHNKVGCVITIGIALTIYSKGKELKSLGNTTVLSKKHMTTYFY